jgi:hypothetical protein
MTVRDVALWKAWHAIEPRGEERADYHTAFLASLLSKNPDLDLNDFLQRLRDMWTPLTAEQEQRRKAKRKRKARNKLKMVGLMAQTIQEAKEAKQNGRLSTTGEKP